VAADPGQQVAVDVLPLEDLPDHPRLVRAVAGDQLVELGPLGRRAEPGQLGGEPAVRPPFDGSVQKSGTNPLGEGHGVSLPCALTLSNRESVLAFRLQRSARSVEMPSHTGKRRMRKVTRATGMM
jgi:hypothetical protein